MHELVNAHLSAGPLDSPLLAQAQLKQAEKPNCDDKPRYTFVGAAASNTTTTLMFPVRRCGHMCWPNTIVKEPALLQRVGLVSVPVVDIVSWIVASFKPKDTVVAKIDIEGHEFPVIETLIRVGALHLIDAMAIECHDKHAARLSARGWTCAGLMAVLQTSGVKLIPEELWHGTDSFSTPDKMVLRLP